MEWEWFLNYKCKAGKYFQGLRDTVGMKKDLKVVSANYKTFIQKLFVDEPLNRNLF